MEGNVTKQSLERLSYIAAHQVLALEGESSLRIPGKQYACAGRRRTELVDRVAAVIAGTFEGAEQAELEAMMTPHERIARR
jgi:hypothetical protein